MIEISPEELLPENFADFKKQIPDLKIADRLSAENPLKPLLTAIENHRQSGMLFKTIVVLLLTYLTLLVAAFLQRASLRLGNAVVVAAGLCRCIFGMEALTAGSVQFGADTAVFPHAQGLKKGFCRTGDRSAERKTPHS